MSHVLKPVVGNRLADAHKTPPAPRLRQRLAQASCRGTPLGSVATGPDGRPSLAPSHTMPNGCDTATAAPSGASICTFLPGTRGRVTATLVEELARQDPGPLAAPCRAGRCRPQGRGGGGYQAAAGHLQRPMTRRARTALALLAPHPTPPTGCWRRPRCASAPGGRQRHRRRTRAQGCASRICSTDGAATAGPPWLRLRRLRAAASACRRQGRRGRALCAGRAAARRTGRGACHAQRHARATARRPGPAATATRRTTATTAKHGPGATSAGP